MDFTSNSVLMPIVAFFTCIFVGFISTSRKKAVPMTPPNFMLANTFGSVMNIRDGPAFRASLLPPENTNTAGMIISPARNAIPVSNKGIEKVSKLMMPILVVLTIFIAVYGLTLDGAMEGLVYYIPIRRLQSNMGR